MNMFTDNPTPVFGLTQAQLWPIAEAMAGEAVADFAVTIEQEPQGFLGWSARKLTPTFRWRTATGRIGETITCVKYMHDRWKQEARHYAYLHAHGFPVVRVYGVLHGPQGEEIFFLEYLDRFWPGGPETHEERLQFLTLRTRLTTLPITPEYGAALWDNPTGREWLEEGRVERVLTQVWETAEAGLVGDALAGLCRENRAALPGLIRYAQTLSERVALMPRALGNGELCPGFAPGSDEMRCFDLHSTGIGPRFADIIHALAIPEGIWTLYPPSWQPRSGYAAHYAREYTHFGNEAVSAQTVLSECDTLWQAQAFNLEWPLDMAQTGKVVWTDDREAAKRGVQGVVHSTLAYLLKQVGRL